MGRIAMQEAIKANGDLAEMESIESFQLTNPSSQIPVPPPMYFSSQKSGPPTMKKIQRPVAVIINSYDDKKEPGKFDFIEAQSNGNGSNFQRMQDDMSTRLKNELEKTLSRSNLRRRSDSMVRFHRFHYKITFSTLLLILGGSFKGRHKVARQLHAHQQQSQQRLQQSPIRRLEERH